MTLDKFASPPLSTIGIKRLGIIHLAFFLLFPGFFFYQTLLGIGAISAFLGGYFSYISLLLIIPLVFFYLTEIKRSNKNFCATDFYYMAFLIYVVSVVLLNFIAGADYKIVRDYLMSIIFAINIFIIFKMIDFNDVGIKRTAMFSLIIMSLIIFYFSTDGLFYLAELGESKNPESVASYQGFARSYLLTFIVAISFVKPVVLRLVIYSVAIPALYINGARSEFVALLGIISVIEICNSTKRIMTAIGCLCFFIIMSLMLNYILPLLPDNRTLQLVDLSQSNSASLRYDFLVRAIHTIYNDPVFGGFGSYPYGEPAHNIMSTWVDFGLFGFVFALALLIFPMLRLVFQTFSSRKKSSYFVFATSLMFMAVLLVLTCKNFEEMYVGAALGAYANFRYRRANV